VKRLADQTLYEILEVPPDASAEEIAAAYDRARATYGPGSLVTYTLMEPDEAALLEARIEDARTTLLDPDRRVRYDEALREPQQARAAAGAGTAAAPPPVAPAEPEGSSGAPPETAASRPTILLGAALEAGGPPEEPPRPAPILLQREVAPVEVAAAAAAPPPEPAEVPAARKPPPLRPPAAAPAVAPEPAPPPPPPAAPPLPDAWTGDALRQVRESRGLSVAQISERTKVTRHHIENIEADRFAALPAQVYLRGILLALARELRLDGQKVARSYIERLAAAGAAAVPAKPR
jgi:hypothetical protein